MELNMLVSELSHFLPGTGLPCAGLTQRGAETWREKLKVPLCEAAILAPAWAVGRGSEEIATSSLQLKGWFEAGSERIEFPCP